MSLLPRISALVLLGFVFAAPTGQAEEQVPGVALYKVSDFGAKGDGVTDDTTAIVAAVNAAKDGGTLRFDQKEYVITGLQHFDGVKNCRFDLTGAVIKNSKPSGTFLFENAQNLTIQGGEFTYVNRPLVQNDADQHPLFFVRCNTVRVENVNIRYSASMGMAFIACRYIWVSHNIVSNTFRDGIHFVNCQDIFCTENLVHNTLDDAIAVNDYGHPADLRTRRATVSGNIIYNCRQGVVVLNSTDVLISNNQVEKTTFSGCQITTNDLCKSSTDGQDGEVARVRVIGNKFLDSGGDFKINDHDITNSGQITTGRAAIVAGYIDGEKGWLKDGNEFFSTASHDVQVISPTTFLLKGDMASRFFVNRRVKLTGPKSGTLLASVTKVRLQKEGTEVEVKFETEGSALVNEPVKLAFNKMLMDVDIIDNEIQGSFVNGIHTDSIYRLRIIGNKVVNCNRANSQWTGTIVEIQGGSRAEFRDNWILEDPPLGNHKSPFAITTPGIIESQNIVE